MTQSQSEIEIDRERQTDRVRRARIGRSDINSQTVNQIYG